MPGARRNRRERADPMQHHQRPPSPGRKRQNAAIGKTVREALNQNRLLFAFQPVVCATSGRIDYFECLLRMREHDNRLVTCGEFIAIDRAGRSYRADRPLRPEVRVCRACRPSGVRLGFNVSGLTASDRPWLRSLMSLLRKQPELAHRVVVEITETAALDDLDESARFVETLRHAGCRVALDDFGAGHTSLRHLQVLAVDTIKIDGSFVGSLADCRENRVILRHLLGLTRGFGLSTIAECVETAEEAALLREEGVGYLQGYHLGRPTIERPWQIGPADPAEVRPRASRACGFPVIARTMPDGRGPDGRGPDGRGPDERALGGAPGGHGRRWREDGDADSASICRMPASRPRPR